MYIKWTVEIDCFSLYLAVVTGASEGIGKAFACEVMLIVNYYHTEDSHQVVGV